MECVAQLSDDEGGDAPVPPNLQAVRALSDEEGLAAPEQVVAAAASTTGRKRKAGSAVNVYEVRVAVGKILQKRCVCSRRRCVQQFSEDAEGLVQLRCELRSLDKRDADAKVP